jgi:hypothetical protein
MQMENIASFLSAATTLGVRASDSFQVVDLFEAKNPFQVVLAIIALKHAIRGFNEAAARSAGSSWAPIYAEDVESVESSSSDDDDEAPAPVPMGAAGLATFRAKPKARAVVQGGVGGGAAAASPPIPHGGALRPLHDQHTVRNECHARQPPPPSERTLATYAKLSTQAQLRSMLHPPFTPGCAAVRRLGGPAAAAADRVRAKGVPPPIPKRGGARAAKTKTKTEARIRKQSQNERELRAAAEASHAAAINEHASHDAELRKTEEEISR